MEVEVFSLESLSYSVRMCEIWLQAYVSPQKKKRSHFPLVCMKFVARIGSHPQHLISDKACEINFDSLLLAKGCQHICLPKSKHHSLGVPEKVIGDLDRNTRAVMADANIPPMYWDIVVQHVALLNACTSPAVCDPSITIFDADTGVVPDLTVFPPSGCFCLRHRASRSQIGCAK